MVDFEIEYLNIILLSGSACQMSGIERNSIDLAYSRNVMKHLEDAEIAFSEIYKALKPNGRYIFLTPNFWDYASLMAYEIPNRLHAKIVKRSEGRSEEDIFPTYYRSNTYYRINRLARRHRRILSKSEYLRQYPSYDVQQCIIQDSLTIREVFGAPLQTAVVAGLDSMHPVQARLIAIRNSTPLRSQ